MNSSQDYLYVGLDVHKKTIAYCGKRSDGGIVKEGVVPATRRGLAEWAGSINEPWIGAMEATLFTGWIYDFLSPYAVELKVANPRMLKAITAAKKKSDSIDARTLADLLRCNLLPECYMASEMIRELRRGLRYRNLLVKEATRMKNKASGLLMEVGAEYDHGRRTLCRGSLPLGRPAWHPPSLERRRNRSPMGRREHGLLRRK